MRIATMGSPPLFYCATVVHKRSTAGRRKSERFLPGADYFLCRHCYNVGLFQPVKNRAYDRMLRRANKLTHRAGGETGSCELGGALSPRGCATELSAKTVEIEVVREPSRTALFSANCAPSSEKETRNVFSNRNK